MLHSQGKVIKIKLAQICVNFFFYVLVADLPLLIINCKQLNKKYKNLLIFNSLSMTLCDIDPDVLQ